MAGLVRPWRADGVLGLSVNPPVAVMLLRHSPEDFRRHGKPVIRTLIFTVDGGHVERNVFN